MSTNIFFINKKLTKLACKKNSFPTFIFFYILTKINIKLSLDDYMYKYPNRLIFYKLHRFQQIIQKFDFFF